MAGYLILMTAYLLLVAYPTYRKFLRKGTIGYRDFRWEKVREEELSERTQKLLTSADREAAALGFFPVLTFIMPHAMQMRFDFRSYLDPAGRIIVTALAPQGHPGPRPVWQLSTRFPDGSRVSTNNSKQSVGFEAPPGWINHSHPEVETLGKLLELHRQHLAGTGRSETQAEILTPTNLMDQHEQDNATYLDYQVQRGILRFDPVTNAYLPSGAMARDQMVAYNNPLVGNNSRRQLLAGPVVMFGGSALLALAGWWFRDLPVAGGSTLVDWLAGRLPLGLPERAAYLLYAPAFLLTGLLSVPLLSDKNGIWAALVTLPLALFLEPQVGQPVGLTILALTAGGIIGIVRLRRSGVPSAPSLLHLPVLIVSTFLFGYLLAGWP